MTNPDQEYRPDNPHAEVEQLLPWYLNGTLAAAEHARVRQHVEHCSDCTAQLAGLRRLREIAQHPDATPIVPAPRVDRVFAAIDRDTKRTRWLQRAKLIASAAGIAVIAIAVAWMTLPAKLAPARFETLTSEPAAGMSSFVLEIEFEPGLSRDDKLRALGELDTVQIDADETRNRYRITMNLPASSVQELDAHTQRIRDLAGIRAVRVVAMQLPLEPR
jgi:Putative zinc-finger